MHHTVAISDIHLCELEPGDGLWMRYRQAPYAPDSELAAMLDALRAEIAPARGGSLEPAPADELTLVLNGDIFDLDAPRVIENRTVFHDQPRSAEYAVPAIKAILADHVPFVAALGRVLADGHTVVLVSGNHDAQLTLPEVRDVVRDRLVEAAVAALSEAGGDGAAPWRREDIAARILFRAWFHRTVDGVVLEHGNQYDAYCAFRYPMAPFGRQPGEVQPTMGSLACRLLVSRMGYFNPHVDASFMLSAPGYIAHWARFYLFSRRSLAVAWALGALRTVAELVRCRDPERRGRRRACLAAAVRETGASLRAVARHARLFARPAEDRLLLVARELWLDRVGLAFAAALVGLLWWLLAPAHLAAAALVAPVALVGYERLVPKMSLGETWRGVSRAARHVARVHKARAVIFGHTHAPEGSWEGGVFFGNTGSWSAAFEDVACTRPLFEERPLIWLRSEGEGAAARLSGGLVTWQGGSFRRSASGAPEAAEGRAPALRAAALRS